MSNEINITGMDKAELLAALYNNSKPLGLGFLQADPNPMTRDEAAEIIREQGLYFDYLKGRVMKINLEGDVLNPRGYDRDNGQGSVATVVSNLKNGMEIQPETSKAFGKGLEEFLANARPTTMGDNGMDLGVDKELREALERARKKFSGPKDNEGGPV
ncbi:MAG: hypothetical protein IT559_06540 [Alphaproteobacteria bacterium]|nr:hypothetical protein [Alphaproteobacteria bacterium]